MNKYRLNLQAIKVMGQVMIVQCMGKKLVADIKVL